MKNKSIILGTMCLFALTNTFAQSEEVRERVSFGLKAGINASNVWDSKGDEFRADSKMGFAGGLFVGIPLGKFIGLQPEVLISQKGFKATGSLLGTPYTSERTTTFLDIPLQLQIKPSDYFTLVAGPQFSYLLNQKDKYTFGANSTEQEREFENDNVRKNILGFVVGADFLYQNFVLSARIGRDFQANNGDGTSNTPRYKNQWLQLTAGLKL